MLLSFLGRFRGLEEPGSPSSKNRASAGTSDSCPLLTCVVCFDVIANSIESNALVCAGAGQQDSEEEEEPSEQPRVHAHATCENCLHEWIKAELYLNNLSPSCPDFDCKRKLNDSELARTLGEVGWNKLSSLRIAKEIESNPLTKWCPNPKCSSIVKRQDVKTKKMECFECDDKGFTFCADCTNPWTTGHTFRCKGEDAAVKQWASGRRTLSSRMFIAEKVSQRCPNCKTRIEKDGGCNHIVCRR
jgi:hypothetical protein